MNIKTIGVVGAGTMGNGIAQVFAQAGFAVHAASTSRSRCSIARARTIEKSLAKFVEKGKLTAADRDAALGASGDARRRSTSSPTPTTSSKRSSRTSTRSARSSPASTRSRGRT